LLIDARRHLPYEAFFTAPRRAYGADEAQWRLVDCSALDGSDDKCWSRLAASADLVAVRHSAEHRQRPRFDAATAAAAAGGGGASAKVDGRHERAPSP